MQLKKFTWTALLVAVAFACVSVAEAKVVKTKIVHSYVTLDGNGTGKSVARVGPFRIWAQCQLDRPRKVGVNVDRVRVYVKSLIGSWFNDGTEYAAGERVRVHEATGFVGVPRWEEANIYYLHSASQGHLLKGYSFATGLNVFGHDCIVQTTVNYIQVESDP